ncbi:hypothetical protein [Paenibacillus antibioticophila]|uniref:hypothetical protein n=1 Tax=Paenibacillus antibioticophila TaxID=1274374 RepID=UPI0005C95F4E|nr:hypothetical protein [Paenibacillus antibioticophila]
MIKSAIEKILSLAGIHTTEIGEQVYTNQELRRVSEPTASTLKVRNLSGLVDYLRNDFDAKLPVMVHIESPTLVSAVTGFNRNVERNTLIQAEALLPNIRFGDFYDVERFNILLQSCFVENGVRSKLLAIVGNVRDENVMSFGDNGISQQVTAKTGVATAEIVPVPNPVNLKPYRTFVEIEQPESSFVFRMQDGPSAAIFEADGGEWKLRAIQEIKSYLDEALKEQISSGQVVIIA